MKKLTRDRVVPIISASVSWLIFAMIGSGLPSLPKFARRRRSRARRFLARIEQLIDQVLFNSTVPSQEMRHEQFGKRRLIVDGTRMMVAFSRRSDHAFVIDAVTVAIRTRLASQASFAEEIDRVPKLRPRLPSLARKRR